MALGCLDRDSGCVGLEVVLAYGLCFVWFVLDYLIGIRGDSTRKPTSSRKVGNRGD